MVKDRIPQKAVELNLNWINSLETCLAEHGNQILTKAVMKAAGEKCSVKITNRCSGSAASYHSQGN